MIRSVSIKIAVLIPVLFTTWLVTSKLMGKPTGLPDRRVTPQLTIDFENRINLKPLDKSSPYRSIKTALSSSWLTGHDIRVEGNAVHVSASVDLTNISDDTFYLWRVRVHREGDHEVVLDRPYLEQVFTMHPSGKMSPTFADSIQLPRGKYRVTLSLYGTPKDYDLANLNDDEKAMAARLVQIPEIVEIR